MATLLHSLYVVLWCVLLPVIHFGLLFRYRQHPAYKQRSRERFGFVTSTSSSPIWIHAASVGEVLVAEPLVKKLLEHHPEQAIVITTTTPTGADIVAKRLPSVQHCYLSYDLPWFHKRFVKTIQPCMLLLIERELWPCLLAAARKQCLIFLVNARLSESSFDRYLGFKSYASKRLFKGIEVFAQTESEATCFRLLGASSVHTLGNIKFDVTPSDEAIALAKKIRKSWGERPVWIVASTHSGEEPQVLDVFQQLKQEHPELLLVLVPRHIERKTEVCQLLNGYRYQCSSESGFDLDDKIEVLLVDELGKLATLYGCADVAFVGGSLVPHGGQNLIEPASWGLATVTGPHTHNFSALVEGLMGCVGLSVANDQQELAGRIDCLLKNPDNRIRLGLRAKEYISQHRGATERHYQKILSHLSTK